MSDKPRKPGPQVEVVRRSVAPTSPAPRPSSGVRPKTAGPGPAPAPRPGSGPPRGPGGGGPRGPGRFGRPSTPRPPPTPEQINELAKRDHVPARIAKGDLEGKMKTRIWRKLHAEEARRFDQAYAVMDKHPGLELADAFGVVQSGLPVDEFLARRARVKKKEAVKTARAAVDPAAVNAFIDKLIADKTELALVLGERTLLDVLTGVAPVSFQLERTGKLEKLQVVVLARKTTWERIGASLPRDPKLSQKPAAIARQPSRRPVSDPRALLDAVGTTPTFQLRNGLEVKLKLKAVGPFDVLLGDEGDELFVPLHAMLSWTPEGAAPPSEG